MGDAHTAVLLSSFVLLVLPLKWLKCLVVPATTLSQPSIVGQSQMIGCCGLPGGSILESRLWKEVVLFFSATSSPAEEWQQANYSQYHLDGRSTNIQHSDQISTLGCPFLA